MLYTVRCTIFIVIILGLTHTAHGQYQQLLHKTYAERRIGLDTLFYYTKEASYDSTLYFKEVTKLSKLASENDDESLYLETKLMRARYYIYGKQNNPDACFANANALLEELKTKSDKILTLRTHLLLGDYYVRIQEKYPPALHHFLLCYNLLHSLSDAEFPDKKIPLSIMANGYVRFSDFENAYKILTEADKLSLLLIPHDAKTFVLMDIKNSLGLIYRNRFQTDSAIYLFKQVGAMAKSIGFQDWVGLADDNIAYCYAIDGEYSKALKIMDHGMPPLSEDNSEDITGLCAYLLTIGNLHVKTNNYHAARPYFERAYRLVKHTRDPHDFSYKLFKGMARFYAGLGDFKKAYTFSDSAVIANDSMKNWQTVMEMAAVRQKVETDLYNSELLRIEDEKKAQIRWRNASVLIVALTSIIIILFINRQSLKHKQKSKLAEAEKRRAEQELQNASIQLDDFTKSIREKNDLIEKITEEIQRYQSLPCSNELPGNNEILIQLQQSVLLTDEQWNQFKSNFEKVHIGFLNRLKEKLPDITPADTRFIVLSKLQLSNKEMAAMLGVSLQAVRTYRYRLRKKLNLPEEGSVEELINMI